MQMRMVKQQQQQTAGYSQKTAGECLLNPTSFLQPDKAAQTAMFLLWHQAGTQNAKPKIIN